MKTALCLLALPLLALTACGEEPEPAPEPVVTPEPVSTLPAPDEELFTEVFGQSCEGAEPVNTASCSHAMGADTATCEFGLGDDEYLRNEAQIEVNGDETSWKLVDPEATCAEYGATYTDSASE